MCHLAQARNDEEKSLPRDRPGDETALYSLHFNLE
jgi:hypothetical protein